MNSAEAPPSRDGDKGSKAPSNGTISPSVSPATSKDNATMRHHASTAATPHSAAAGREGPGRHRPRPGAQAHEEGARGWRPVNSFIENWGYLAIFILTLLESACVPIPSEVTLGLGGALASGAVVSGIQGNLNLGWVIVIGIAGSVVGSVLAYWVGRTGGRTFVDSYGRYVLLSHRDLDRAEAWFKRRGDWAVLVGRVIPVIRTFISLPAGLAEMNFSKFITFTTVGVAAWVALLSTIGYYAGSSWNTVTKGFSYASYVVAAVAVVAVVLFVIVRIRALRRERSEVGGSDKVAEQSGDRAGE